ncbi:MAG: orotate phosphoribosyltransferase [Rhodospirillales bacterium]|nr:MAG: orotate phosphoribosyltransferase [Rhodospirillales bacterium]
MAAKKKKVSAKTAPAKKPAKKIVAKPAARAKAPAAKPAKSAPKVSAAAQAAARDVSRLLIEIKAVHCRPEQPYIFTSGRASPVYIDCRKIISFPEARAKIMAHAHKVIGDAIGWSKIDVVAGGETAGIPFSAFIAQTAKKPMIYVRKQPKGFGRMAQIEGELKPGQRVLLVEDLATDGGSKIMFIEALRKAEAKVTDCFVVFHYGIFPQSVDTLSVMGVKLHQLATWWDVLAAAERGKYFDAKGLAETRGFLEAPDAWSAAHGGAGPKPGQVRMPSIAGGAR